MDVTAIIPTKDRTEMLADTLASLADCDPAPDEVIVVDGSAEQSAREIAQRAGARYLPSPPGLCRQRNNAVAEAAGDVIVFLDDDVLLERDAIGRLVAAFADPGVVGATGRIEEPDPRLLSFKRSRVRRLLPGGGRQGTMTPGGYPNRLWDLDSPHELEFLYGCFMAARTHLVRELRFDERLEAKAGYALAEDEDFGYRLSRRGRIRFVPDARIVHRNTGFASSRSRAFNHQLVYNRDYLFRKNFPQTFAARAHWWTIMAITVVHRVVNRDWNGVRGLFDGFREVARRA